MTENTQPETDQAESKHDDETPERDPYVGVSRPFPMGSRAPRQE